MDMNTNRNVKLMQVSSKVAEKASSDGTTNKQCRPVHRQTTEMTVTDASTNFADKPKPTLSQRPAVAAEEARTDGTIDVQCRSNDHDYMKTTVMNLPTDFVKVMKPTLSRVSPVGAKEAHIEVTTIVQYHSNDQNSMMTTIMQTPMDFLEIPEPSLPRGFLELAEEAKHVDVGSGQSCYTEEVQSHEAGLTRPVLVTIIECREETERPIQIDFMKTVETDGPVSVVDTPPSSDSGVHSWGEQWENMSISMTDTDTEQNGRPEICSQTGRCVGDTRESPNTKNVESDELSSSGSQN